MEINNDDKTGQIEPETVTAETTPADTNDTSEIKSVDAQNTVEVSKNDKTGHVGPEIVTAEATPADTNDTLKAKYDNTQNTVEVSKDDKTKHVEPETVTTEATPENTNETPDAKSDTVTEKCAENVHYEGEVAVYTDPSTNYQYIWDKEKEEWVPRNNVTYGFEDDTHTYTDAEGIKYFWDKEKNAWFPKIDDEFMAIYQLNYGFVDNTQPEEKPKEVEETKVETKPVEQGLKRKVPPPEPTWFDVDEKHNTNMYVSNLPLDLSEQEFVDFMQKCGLVMRDGASGKMKVKLYTDPESKLFKGDALCTYIRIESIDLALKLLDGADLKGNKVKVERAKFQMKGTFDPTLKPKKRKKKDKEKLKRMQEKLFDWRPERMRGERAKHEKVVIVKNVFESSMFDTDVGLILEFQQDLREECSKCGTVRKVIIYDRHPEGVAQVNMKEPEEADAVVQLLNGRWFGKRKLTAEIWNGRTKFKIAETDSQISQRIEKWDKFLEDDEQKTEAEKNSKETTDKKEKIQT